MLDSQLPVVITMGDPAGIGGEITLKSWLNHRQNLPPFFVIDSPERLENLAVSIGLDVSVETISSPERAASLWDRSLPVLPIILPKKSAPGMLLPENGAAVQEAIERAFSYVLKGQASAMVTNPIHKSSLYETGFDFPGHTEFLTALAGIKTEPIMMLATDNFRVVPITKHVGLREAMEILTPDLIIETVSLTANSLAMDFGIENPRLAIAALNPHAGENGEMGGEEVVLIKPAIEKLQKYGLNVSGPFPPDTLFHPAARKKYDVVFGMYHDQVLIPIKTIAFEKAVNITLGLPFIRTSPDHGTALDIAGTGQANEQSLIAAIKMAAQLAEHRQQAKLESLAP